MARNSGIRREALHIEGPTVGYAMATELTKKIGVVIPFLQWPLVTIAAFVLHMFWPDNMYVLAFLGVAALVFSVFCWYLTHDRKGLASEHAVFTVLSYGTVLGLVDHMGWTRFTTFVVIFVVFLICCSWSMRNIIRHHDEKQGANISSLFDTAGLDGTKMHIKPEAGEVRPRWSWPNWFTRGDHGTAKETETDPKVQQSAADGKVRREPVSKRRVGKILLKPGETVENLQKRMPSVESAAGVPPGTFMVTEDMDNAQRADVVISDPRSIKNPILYPGPSYLAGASIADTISVGVYQDGSEVEFDILGLQIQIMGMIGSGKSLGAGWSALAEIITRKDVVVWGIDVTKGFQTLGPLMPALHRLATTPEQAKQLLTDANALIKPRTDYLATKGLGKWQKGCGLKYLVVWLEEVPDIMEALDDEGEELWIKSVKAARSAGISFVWSLQRADYSQIPTITRGQAAKWCFGVADSHEASFGLSTVQDNADCSPEKWGNRHPGKFYLDAPSIAEDKVPMAARAWYWGKDDSIIRAHAAKYPADDREPDAIMQKVLARTSGTVPIEPKPERRRPISVPNRDVETDDDAGEVEDEMITDADLDRDSDEELTNDFALTREKQDPMPPAAARSVVRNWLVARKGQTVRNADLTDVRNSTGYGRQWGYKVLGEFETEGLVRRVDSEDGVSWVVTDLDSILSQDV